MRPALLIAAAGLLASPPTDPVRAGVAAFAAGDLDEADRLFRSAAERTADPGLVAFNRAAVAGRRADWRSAEVGYRQALDDDRCPPRRRAEATFNLGVCLLHRGTAAAYRTAVDLFQTAADLLNDDPLAADARHNRELAKLLWADARRREQPPPAAGDDPPPLPDPPDLGGSPAGEPGRLSRRPAGAGGSAGDGADDPTSPGGGGPPVPADAAAARPLSPADTRRVLAAAAARLARDRRDAARLQAGPDRPDVPDW